MTLDKLSKRISKYNAKAFVVEGIFIIEHKDKRFESKSISGVYKEFKQSIMPSDKNTGQVEFIRGPIDVEILRNNIGRKVKLTRYLYNSHTSIESGTIHKVDKHLHIFDQGAQRVISLEDIIEIKIG